jgi:transcriptional regulator with XRE-family HTH domain/mannose-6-phosphate isomerase-like protein (cupin superfamily)
MSHRLNADQVCRMREHELRLERKPEVMPEQPPSKSAGHSLPAPLLKSVGQRLRDARDARRIGVREMARRIGVSPSFISQIELGRANPSVGTLYAIVSELSLSLDDLMLEPDRGAAVADPPVAAAVAGPPALPEPGPSAEWWSRPGPVQPAEGRKSIHLPGVTWERLTAVDDAVVDFLRVIYEPGGESCPADNLVRHGGMEYGHILDGQLHVQVGFETYELDPGDSISFDSTTPHRLHNPGPGESNSIWVVVGRRADPRVPATVKTP